jgi:hypothetical protein
MKLTPEQKQKIYAKKNAILKDYGYKLKSNKKSHRGTISRLYKKLASKQTSIVDPTKRKAEKKPWKVVDIKQPLPGAVKVAKGKQIVDVAPNAKAVKPTKYGYSYKVGKQLYKVIQLDRTQLATRGIEYIRELMAKYGRAGSQYLLQSHGREGDTTYSAKTFDQYILDTVGTNTLEKASEVFTIKIVY